MLQQNIKNYEQTTFGCRNGSYLRHCGMGQKQRSLFQISGNRDQRRDKANRESVLMMVIFPIVKLLNEKYYTRNDYETLFEINSSYAVKYLRKKERNKLLELLSAYFLHVESFRQRVAAWMRSLLVWVADLKCIQK